MAYDYRPSDVPDSWQQGINEQRKSLAQAISNQQNNLQLGINREFAKPMAQQALEKALQYNKYYGPDKESEIGLRGAQSGHLGAETNKINTMLPMEAEALRMKNSAIRKSFEPPVLKNTVEDLHQRRYITPEQKTEFEKNIGDSNLQVEQNVTPEWKAMPVAAQNAMIEQGINFGLPRDVVYHALSHGAPMGDLAQMTGYDRSDSTSWPKKEVQTTARTRSLNEQAKLARAGIEATSEDVSKASAPYLQTFGGIPVKHMANVIAGVDDREKWGEAVAANTFQHEIAIMQAKSGGVQPGIGAMKQIMGTMMVNTEKVPSLARDQVAAMAAQRWMNKEYAKLNDAEQKAFNELNKPIKPKAKNSIESAPKGPYGALQQEEKQNPPAQQRSAQQVVQHFNPKSEGLTEQQLLEMRKRAKSSK